MKFDGFVQESPKWIFIILWLAANVALFSSTFVQYWTFDEFCYLRSITKASVAVSRGSADALKLNCAMILLPVCRYFITLFRRLLGMTPRPVCRTLDSSITFHKLCAYMICFFTALHYWGHTFNFERFIEAAALPEGSTDLRYGLSYLPVAENGTWINPIRMNDTVAIVELFTALSGWTGAIAILCLVLMVSSSTEIVRRNYYEVFWFTHHLFIVFYAMIIVHGFARIIRGQTNLDQHDLKHCSQNWTTLWGSDPRCAIPQFEGEQPTAWMWVICPLTMYVIERIIRIVRSFQKVTIRQIVQHPSPVVEIQMEKPSWFRMTSPGQYIYVKCCQASGVEWHPFTMTSAPGDDYISVHIRQSGDWTSALAAKCKQYLQDKDQPPSLSIDGPYGTCSDDVFSYEVSVLIGAGIGVTPFASILKHIWHQDRIGQSGRLRKVYFYWVCREPSCFEWFVELLRSLENQVQQSARADLLDINIYWTLSAGFDREKAFHIIDAHDDTLDVLTGLRNKTHYGRPNWDLILSRLTSRHRSKQVGVFLCGPKEMSTSLRQLCAKHSDSDPRGTHFVFNKENF